MSEKMPARIWAHPDMLAFTPWSSASDSAAPAVVYVRADIAERMAAALEAILPFIPKSSAADGGPNARSANVAAADKVRSALSAWKEGR